MDHKEPHKSSFSILESIALEIESLFREVRAVLICVPASEKFALFFALLMFLSCFLPWFSASLSHTQSGIDGFGTVHFGISITVLFLVRTIAHQRFHWKLSQSKTGFSRGRITSKRAGLWFLCLGALSTATCIALLLHFGDLASAQEQINVRYGFYLVLSSGLGISASGFAKFV